MNLTIKNPRTISVASNPTQQNLAAQQAVITPAQFLANVGQLNKNQKTNLPPAAKKDQDKGKKTAKEEPIKFDDIKNLPSLLRMIKNQQSPEYNGVKIDKVSIRNTNQLSQNLHSASRIVEFTTTEAGLFPGSHKSYKFDAGDMSPDRADDYVKEIAQAGITAESQNEGSQFLQSAAGQIALATLPFIIPTIMFPILKHNNKVKFEKNIRKSFISSAEKLPTIEDKLKDLDPRNLRTSLSNKFPGVHTELLDLADRIQGVLSGINGKEDLKPERLAKLLGYVNGATGTGKSSVMMAITQTVMKDLENKGIKVGALIVDGQIHKIDQADESGGMTLDLNSLNPFYTSTIEKVKTILKVGDAEKFDVLFLLADDQDQAKGGHRAVLKLSKLVYDSCKMGLKQRQEEGSAWSKFIKLFGVKPPEPTIRGVSLVATDNQYFKVEDRPESEKALYNRFGDPVTLFGIQTWQVQANLNAHSPALTEQQKDYVLNKYDSRDSVSWRDIGSLIEEAKRKHP